MTDFHRSVRLVAAAVVVSVPLLLAACEPSVHHSDVVLVAVASNFHSTLETIASHYENETGVKVVASSGSTGGLFAKISNGAPYDIFLSADSVRAAQLHDVRALGSLTRFTYAIGILVLWSSDVARIEDSIQSLQPQGQERLAIANPLLAPYGFAAVDVLRANALEDAWKSRMVFGESIGQTFQFVSSGAAELGFISYAQLVRAELETSGSFWIVPDSMHLPLVQQAVLLSDNPAAASFFEYLRGPSAQALIQASGYLLP